MKYYISTISIPIINNIHTRLSDNDYKNESDSIIDFVKTLIKNKYLDKELYDNVFDVFYIPILCIPKELNIKFDFDNNYIQKELKAYVYEIKFNKQENKWIFNIEGKMFLDNECI